ncbi:purple acid phosphatase 22-like [Amaranthus tricolor]|uniref:purple acid phosphatase 22-like n=1 Tax=Amaranthus tricolor TaxID=29722 RepID=UPI0025878DE2|nr:purple acid phosphatase 22-like [Amaranthus tricolor]
MLYFSCYFSLIEKMAKPKTCANLLMIFLINSLIFTTFPSQSRASSSVDFVRPPARSVIVTPHNRSASDPQQVHVSLVGKDQMRITWITQGMAPSIVEYGTNSGEYDTFAKGDHKTYHYFMYSSGRIHNVVIGPLKPNTTYYYRCSNKGPQFSLRTPPPSFPIEFAIVGDLGQTEWTKSTLEHVGQRNYDVFLLPGDLSYADTQQPLWDSFGRLVEPYASRRPWMVTQGNHEVEFLPFVSDSFRAYNARWGMPYEESGSTSNLYYSFDVYGAHIIMLGSYTDHDVDSAQYTWLQNDLAKIDRSKTPWIIVLLHAPWYNSNTAHKGEGESMRRAMEDMLYNARVDVVFAGHVHAYERFTRVYNNQVDPCGPLYITIGDGGNREGLALMFEDPAPSISMYREPSFGHGRLRLVDGKKAHWSWHRNKDSNATTFADEVWLENLSTTSSCSSNGSKFSHDEF